MTTTQPRTTITDPWASRQLEALETKLASLRSIREHLLLGINAARSARGLSGQAWQSAVIAAGVDPITADAWDLDPSRVPTHTRGVDCAIARVEKRIAGLLAWAERRAS